MPLSIHMKMINATADIYKNCIRSCVDISHAVEKGMSADRRHLQPTEDIYNRPNPNKCGIVNITPLREYNSVNCTMETNAQQQSRSTVLLLWFHTSLEIYLYSANTVEHSRCVTLHAKLYGGDLHVDIRMNVCLRRD